MRTWLGVMLALGLVAAAVPAAALSERIEGLERTEGDGPADWLVRVILWLYELANDMIFLSWPSPGESGGSVL